ncbi:MAG: hypothetical protein JXA21_11280 [Anaerolineae bacterium]|nr:hypothetical protein [Anaerolineae bacterium]
MNRMATFKVRRNGDRRSWARLPIAFDSGGPVDAGEARGLALRRMAHFPDIAEVRWEWPPNLQGHYVSREANARAILHVLIEEEVRDWQGAIRSAANELEAFYRQLERWLCQPQPVDDEAFRAALRKLSDEGLVGWLRDSPLNVDKLHGLLTGTEWDEKPDSIEARLWHRIEKAVAAATAHSEKSHNDGRFEDTFVVFDDRELGKVVWLTANEFYHGWGQGLPEDAVIWNYCDGYY